MQIRCTPTVAISLTEHTWNEKLRMYFYALLS